jgi:hypothetical protein
MKAKREREPDDHRERPLHMFGDVGPAIAEADYRPGICGNPEETLAAAFIKMKRDYGGPLPADLALARRAAERASLT